MIAPIALSLLLAAASAATPTPTPATPTTSTTPTTASTATTTPATSDPATPASAAPGGSPSAAPAQPIVFRDRAEERRFRALTEQLRCVMCQNQSLADSNAMIAQDLRMEVLHLMREGRSDDQIKMFLVERYTDFVLYQPKVQPMTWALWFGPGVLLLGGIVVIILIVRKQKRQVPPAADNQEQEW